MGLNITEKILSSHLVGGKLEAGSEIAIRIDQTLTQDATGTMTYLQFEAMNVPRVRTELSVSYVDHNTIQIGFENADDHLYLQSVAQRYGIYFSRPGNGICHQIHLERFGKPGKTLLGADSHTPTCGALGMFALGAGGLDVALAMAGEPFYLKCPRVIRINLEEELPPWVSAKDVILYILSIFTTKGNVGYVFEYGGEGLKKLTVPERATIANMGAECGVTTSIFPSDDMTRLFLRAQGRENDWIPLEADRDAQYDRIVTINLSELEPLAACPHSPDNVKRISEIENIPVHQVCVGSCTNSSYRDLATVAEILSGRVTHKDVSFVVAPGSRQVVTNLLMSSHLRSLITSGARIMENACGFCIGNSQSPPSGGVSLRTSNRNFYGRSGTKDAYVYLVSPETAAAALITGRITDPRKLNIEYPRIEMPEKFCIDDSMIIPPLNSDEAEKVQILRGPNIGSPPLNTPMPENIKGVVAIKLEDNITTDHIIPAGDRMKYRSNISRYAQYLFEVVDPEFYKRAIQNKERGFANIIVAGKSYGQGSSREHAALCPAHVGVRFVIAKSFERIHASNLINSGILPLTFSSYADYDSLGQGDTLEIVNIREALQKGESLIIHNISKKSYFTVKYTLSQREKAIILAGGMLNIIRERNTHHEDKS
ncbi:MAG: aconitate hydratase [Syntrophales bacterium]|nr:aconitate hydratase [Syntrophales bacterium]